jgi:hypothetical protein
MDNKNENQENSQIDDTDIAAGAIAVGTVAGAGLSATIGGMGLTVAGAGIGIGMAPVAAAGAVVGSAAFGAKKAIEDQDPMAVGAIATGAVVGAGTSAALGGMGLALTGTAIGIGMAPIAAAGAVVGLAGYGFLKLLGGNDDKKKEDEKSNFPKKEKCQTQIHFKKS